MIFFSVELQKKKSMINYSFLRHLVLYFKNANNNNNATAADC